MRFETAKDGTLFTRVPFASSAFREELRMHPEVIVPVTSGFDARFRIRAYE